MNDQLEQPQAVETRDRVSPSPYDASAPSKVSPRVLEGNSVEADRTASKAAFTRTAYDDNEEIDATFVGRHRVKLVVATVLIVGAGIGYFMTREKTTRPYKAPERVVSIQVPPPPAPPHHHRRRSFNRRHPSRR